jgi:hypothetical protein
MGHVINSEPANWCEFFVLFEVITKRKEERGIPFPRFGGVEIVEDHPIIGHKKTTFILYVSELRIFRLPNKFILSRTLELQLWHLSSLT